MAGAGQPYQGNGGLASPPPQVRSKENIPKAPIKLGNSTTENSSSSGAGEKRKSWLKRRFSKAA